ncbi:PilZ domain-containing protein [Novosphingobium sp. BL-8A]|uniref:PilZ domain-containing protein n=1 Tax=Novosphingobium sp. BL-8A TaxID=3127639 RepID=UPI003757C4A3
MSEENRQIARDSLFLMADLRVDGLEGESRIKVRNLSPGGMMGEGALRIVRGTSVKVNIRNIGWVPGAVAWVQDNRFGVAFGVEIDPKLARVNVGAAEADTPRFVRTHEALYSPDTSALRKI